MSINYDINTISNVDGENKQHRYVQLQQLEPLTEDQLLERIEKESTLTRSDVLAALSAVSRYAVQELSCGHRFHVPGLGYFSLSAKLDKAYEELPDEKIRGNHISVRGINFLPEQQVVNEIAEKVNFVRAQRKARPTHYTEEQMWARINGCFDNARYITKSMLRQLGLSKYIAQKWLDLFVQKGLLVKDGTPHAPTYFKAAE